MNGAGSAKAEGAQGGNGQGADGQNGKQAGSSAGLNDGDKTIQAADQRAAMGKISMILGKRSENVTGSAAVEVLSGEQALNTPYARRKAEHQDVHAKGERDEVPLELQAYVNSYFARLRQSGASAPRSQKK